MLTLTNDMMRSIIMDHYSNPTNKHEPTSDKFEKIHMHSDNCIDDLNIFLLVENNIVRDACFEGVACTISTASTDIMCDLLKGKNIEEAKYIIKQYDNMIHVHHIVPVSEIGEEYVVDPVKDLIPVCPNCHMVLHAGTDITVEKLRERLKK